MPEYKVHQLWPKPVFENEIPVKTEWVNFAHKCDYERMASENGDYTTDKYILDKLPDLKDLLLEQVYLFTTNFLKIIDTEFYYLNSWIVKHYPNDWAHPHMHNNSLLSGVYYLDTSKDVGDIKFIRGCGEQEIFPSAITPNYSEFNWVNSTETGVKVSNGKLLIFPSNLMHSVEPNLSQSNRYSLAFNVFCKGTFGEKESKLTL